MPQVGSKLKSYRVRPFKTLYYYLLGSVTDSVHHENKSVITLVIFIELTLPSGTNNIVRKCSRSHRQDPEAIKR